MAPTRGRPRSTGPSPSGQGTEVDILTAAARLFCTEGYGSTSTHRLAEEAGIRQASIYHYFVGKHAILLALLQSTVRPSLDVAEHLLDRAEPAPARLWALCVSDVQLLSSGPVNLGSLYLLPELRDPRFEEFHALRGRLRAAYLSLVSACLGVGLEEARRSADLVLALVESVILRRREQPQLDVTDLAPRIGDAALRILELPAETVRDARLQGAGLLGQT